MLSDNDHVFGNSIESDLNNEDRNKNLDGQENHPVFYTDKNVTACDLTEIVVSNNKKICVDEGGVPMMQEKFLFNEKGYVRLNPNPLEESKLEDSTRFEERSFSQEDSGLAHITYSGPISFTGSLSVRSDGSTFSGSSFAFPVLQSEWNSSPIRMVKVEKKQVRKEKGWRHFQILQSERNRSYIRMVKAEKKQARKEKGWRRYSRLLCCRF